MAFKPDRPMGFFDMCHLNPETIKFAKLLRDGPPKDIAGENWKDDLSPEEVLILEQDAKEKKAERKIKPCAVKECKETERSVQMVTIERVHLLKKIEEATEAVSVLEEDAKQLEQANEQVEAEAAELTLELAALRSREKKEIKEKVVHATRLKQQLDIAILKAHAELSKVKDAAKVEADTAAREQQKAVSEQAQTHTALPPVNFEILYEPPHGHKHTGAYLTTASGFKQWSCCLADDEDQRGCQDDQSVGLRSTLVHKTEAAHHPFVVRQQEHVAASKERHARLHLPSSCPPQMNKGFRDVRSSHENFSYYSRHLGEHTTSLQIAQQASAFLGAHKEEDERSPQRKKANRGASDDQSAANSRKSGGKNSVSIGEGAHMHASVDSTDSRGMHLDNARTSLVFLGASLAQTNSFTEQKLKRRGQSQRPSTAGAFPLTGSMRVSQKRVTSGPYPAFANIDLSLLYNPAGDPGMAQADVANGKIDPKLQVLDSASLLASYSKSVGTRAVGQQRHLGLTRMHRTGGRPLTSQKGPHLLTTSTTGVATSLAHFCQQQC